jgi:hypothetical protein
MGSAGHRERVSLAIAERIELTKHGLPHFRPRHGDAARCSGQAVIQCLLLIRNHDVPNQFRAINEETAFKADLG